MSLMGYRSTLLRSVIALTVFYSLAAAVAFYSMGPETLQTWLEAAGFWVEGDTEINPANAASAATEVVLARSYAVWPWLAGGMAAGSAIILLMVGVEMVTRRQRAKARGEYRGMDLSITYMPCPDPVAYKPVKAQLAGDVPAHHLPLINQLLGYLQAHPEAFCGDGHSTTLLEHHLGVIDEAFEYKGADPLLPLAAAAHDIGKTVSHAKRDGQWVRLAYHDKESGRLLAKFPAWWELPEEERSILKLAVKYEHSPNLMPVAFPGLCSKGMRRAITLLQQLREIDGLATRGEKRKVLETLNVRELAIETFLRVVPQVPYQVKGLAKRVKAAGFRVGERLYLSEHHIRETALAKLDGDVAAAFGGDFRARGQAGEFTQVLLAALADRGWLITEIEGVPEGSEMAKTWSLPADQALWRVRSGIIEFRGMIAVELPAEHQGLYPRETAYEVTVLGPQGKHSSNAGVAPTKDSGKRVDRMHQPKGIPASEVCDVSLFATAPAGARTPAEKAVSGKGSTSPDKPTSSDHSTQPPWLIEQGDAAPKTSGDVAQKAKAKSDTAGGNVAQESANAAVTASTPSTDSHANNDVAGAWLLDDSEMAGGDVAQEDTRQPMLSGGDAAQDGKDAQSQQAPAKGKADEEADLAGEWLLEDAASVGGDTAQNAGGDIAQVDPRQSKQSGGNVAQEEQDMMKNHTPAKGSSGSDSQLEGAWLLEETPESTSGDVAQKTISKPESASGDVAPIAEQPDPQTIADEGGQVASDAGASTQGDVAAELDDWSPEVGDDHRDPAAVPGQGGCLPDPATHAHLDAQPAAEDGTWLLGEDPKESPQAGEYAETRTQADPEATSAVMADAASANAEQPQAAVARQDDAEATSPIQRRLKKRGGASAGRQDRKASSSEAPAVQGQQPGQGKANKGTIKPGGAKAEVKGVPKLFS
ncbi:hypothetical protein [Modicisalibacter xianhensis]|uniref:HD domain-containing protein n=1 Tax=Modicisalibacter xianhensis TaxID=442341 RepID=A0A1I3FPL1_9GAMM|nr:hypothetical protein [Halomonas xianhensis]SFI13139.1 hypothetical protein SAMN04487959_12021 [Halomonas xianhensis]